VELDLAASSVIVASFRNASSATSAFNLASSCGLILVAYPVRSSSLFMEQTSTLTLVPFWGPLH
jgi:hypothetical protein